MPLSQSLNPKTVAFLVSDLMVAMDGNCWTKSISSGHKYKNLPQVGCT